MPTNQLKPSSSDTFNVRVQTMDAELEFSLERTATGRDLFDLVCRTIGLREIWYFGLQFINKDGYCSWLRLEKLVLRQRLKKSEAPYHFLFLAKFFPEEVTEELIQEVTQHLFLLQVKQAILSMDLYCPPEVSLLLASYALQAKYGDFDESLYKPEMLALDELLPQRVIEQYQMTKEMWEERIKNWWTNNKGIPKEDAELEYLRIAQDLHMFGISYFPVYNKKNSDCWLGVSPSGLHIFTKDNRLNPMTSFTWAEIKNISFSDKKFVIKTNAKERDADQSGKDILIFYSENLNINKLILDLCVGNHSLWLRRRQADSMEVQQMKLQAKEARERRQVERARLLKEQNARLESERERDRLRQELTLLQEQFNAAQEALSRSEETADLLAEKARISEEEALVLAKRASEAEAEIQRLRISTIKTEEEKILLERKAREAELIAARVLDESSKKSKEAERLKEDLIRARQAERIAKDRLSELMGNPYAPLPPLVNGYAAAGAAPHHFSNGNLPAFDRYSQRDMRTLSAEIEKERVEYIQKSKHLQDQLSELRSEIEGLKVEDRVSDVDRLYEESLQQGDTKYATLRKTSEAATDDRSGSKNSGAGNASAKIALFEGL